MSAPPRAVPTAPAAGAMHLLLNRLVAVYSEGSYRPLVAQAREEYLAQAGKVFEDDAELFESRMASFLEWYILERPCGEGPPPVEQALAASGEEWQLARSQLAHLATSHRSLFDIAQVEGSLVHLEDVLGGARFVVIERRGTLGFEAGELMEARLMWDGEQLIFGKTFLFHPRDAREVVLDLVDSALQRGTARDEIMFQLSRLHLRWHRLNHVGAARVYKGHPA